MDVKSRHGLSCRKCFVPSSSDLNHFNNQIFIEFRMIHMKFYAFICLALAMINQQTALCRINRNRTQYLVVHDVKSKASIFERFSSSHLFLLSSGETTPAKLQAIPTKSTNIITTYVRIFPTSVDEPELRSNGRWYEISHAIRNGVRFFTKKNKTHNFGYFGDCVLSDLAFIDRGRSFMADTLHSIYHGAFVNMKYDFQKQHLVDFFSFDQIF